jgi:hypothetical protein
MLGVSVRKVRRRRAQAMRIAGVVSFILGGATVFSSVMSVDASTVGAAASIVDATSLVALTGPQPSIKQFSVTLPAQAACTGDTAHDGYHEFSYLIPGGSSLSAVNFETGVPSTGFGYFTPAPSYVGALATAPNTAQVSNLPLALAWRPAIGTGGLVPLS